MRKTVFLSCVLLACPALAGELYRWTDPETGKAIASPALPPYPIKEKVPGGQLPSGDVIKLILDENSPQYKAAVARRKAEEDQIRQKEEAMAKQKAEKEARETEERRLTAEAEAKRQAASKTREPTEDEIQTCLGFLRQGLEFKDPESVRVEDRGLITVYKDGEKNLTFKVNAKNSYGAYAGAKTYNCKYFPEGSFKINDW